jgi:hypothetical protein
MVGCWSGSCGVLKVVSGWRIPRLASSRTPNSWVGELLTRIGPGGVHGGRDAIGHDLAVRAVLGPARDRVAQLLAAYALEGLHLTGLVQPTEQVVERAVLEHHHNHVIQRSPAVSSDHRGSPSIASAPAPQRRPPVHGTSGNQPGGIAQTG